MTCGPCGFENPEGVTFCGGYGQALNVADLAAGAGFPFHEGGRRELKGVPGTWQLYEVVFSP
jgi:hypothetical protein